MSQLVFAESFELFLQRPSVGFSDFLRESGYVVTGSPEYAPGRDGLSVAADLSGGGFTARLETSDPVVTFGFAALVTEACRALVISDEVTLDLGSEVFVSGFSSPDKTGLGRWLYYELLVDKIRREIDLYINDQFQASYPMPGVFRFRSEFELAFLSNQGLLVDDIGVSTTGRVGPIAARAFDVDTPLPRELGMQGQRAGGLLSPGADLPETALAVTLAAEAQLSDLDVREAVLYSGGDERALTLGTQPKVNERLFSRAPDGGSWTLAKLSETPFGVRVSR